MSKDDQNQQAEYRRWLDETFAIIRAEIGGRPDQNGASRDYGRASEKARFGYHMLSDEGDVEFSITMHETAKRRNVAPMQWRLTSSADAAESVLRAYRELRAAGHGV